MTKRYRYTAVVPWPCQQKGLLSHLLGSTMVPWKQPEVHLQRGDQMLQSSKDPRFFKVKERGLDAENPIISGWFFHFNGHFGDFPAMFDDTEGYPKPPKHQIPQGFPWRRTPGSSFRCRWEIATATGPVDWMRPGLGDGVVGWWGFGHRFTLRQWDNWGVKSMISGI